MDNYICINGVKIELTPEQLKKLGIEPPKVDPFIRVDDGDTYYMIDYYGEVVSVAEYTDKEDYDLFKIANYCTDKSIMEQRALHEILNRLLWRYSMEHDGDKIEENHHAIIKYRKGTCEVYNTYGATLGAIQFYDTCTARAAIKEIIEPFMKEHPEFKW